MKTSIVWDFSILLRIPGVGLTDLVQSQSQNNLRLDIAQRNYDILLKRIYSKTKNWYERLFVQFILLQDMFDEHYKNPEDKDLQIEIQKMYKSFFDSLKDFSNYFVNITSTPIIPPTEPIKDDSLTSFKNVTFNKKLYYRDRDKRRTKERKRARKQKMEGREFWMDTGLGGNYSFLKNGNFCCESESSTLSYEQAHDNLLAAEKALLSPCIEEASWAIFEGTEAEYADVIKQANKVFENYLKALEIYEMITTNG